MEPKKPSFLHQPVERWQIIHTTIMLGGAIVAGLIDQSNVQKWFLAVFLASPALYFVIPRKKEK